jgi:hypothetical protein
VLREAPDAEILRFPGREDEYEDFGPITQQGTLDGEVIRVGGTRETVPVILRSENELISDCYASKTTAKALGGRLFEPVRLFGTGRWTRDDVGTWKLDHFTIDRFEPLTDEPLSSVVGRLRSIQGAEWGDNALEDLRVIRQGSGEKRNGGV